MQRRGDGHGAERRRRRTRASCSAALRRFPYRALKAEAAIRGKSLDDASAAAAGLAAVDGARPLAKNGYKVPLTQAVVKRALLSLA